MASIYRSKWQTNVLCVNCGTESKAVAASHVSVAEAFRLWNKMMNAKPKTKEKR